MRKDPSILLKIYTVNLFPAIPEGTYGLSQGNCTLGKGNNESFQGLLNTGSELTLIPGKPECQSGDKIGACGGQVINGVLG